MDKKNISVIFQDGRSKNSPFKVRNRIVELDTQKSRWSCGTTIGSSRMNFSKIWMVVPLYRRRMDFSLEKKSLVGTSVGLCTETVHFGRNSDYILDFIKIKQYLRV